MVRVWAGAWAFGVVVGVSAGMALLGPPLPCCAPMALGALAVHGSKCTRSETSSLIKAARAQPGARTAEKFRNPPPHPPTPAPGAADVYMIDEPSSYLDVRQRLKAAEVIRSLLGPDR